MSIAIMGGTPGGPSVRAGELLAAANAFGGFIGGVINAAVNLIQGAAGDVPADSIILLNTNILEHRRVKEYDGPTYLWTRHTIRLRAIYNPLLNSYNQNNPRALPSARAGFKGPVTDVTLRHYLAQPRRNLQLYVGGQLYFQSPRAGTRIDAQNGPFPRVNHIALISGTKTFLVDLTFETCLNESYLFTQHPSVMLSHTFSSEHDVDQDFYLTRVIHGHAFFDTSRLMQLGARADDFRAYLFHGISPGFHRVAIQAQVDEGGGELLYTIVDREVTHSLGEYAVNKGVTRIECTHGSEISKPDIEAQAASIFKVGDDVVQSVLNSKTGTLKGSKLGATLAGIKGLWGLARNIPVNTQNIVCRVWGNNNSSREGLRSVCGNVLRFRAANLNRFSGATKMSWLDDVRGKFVQGTLTVTQPPVLTALNRLAPQGFGLLEVLRIGLNIQDILRPFFASPPGGGLDNNFEELPEGIGNPLDGDVRDSILSVTPQFGSRPPSSGISGRLPGDAGARGTYIETLVSSALLAPNEAPPASGNFPFAKSRTPPDGVVTDPILP